MATMAHQNTNRTSQQYCYLNTVWNVYDCAGGLSNTHLDKIFTVLHALSEQSKKLFVLRFDLHLPNFSSFNKDVSELRDRLFEKIDQDIDSRTRKYISAKKRKALIWAREQESSKAQHYHCALILDGQLFNHPKKVMLLIRKIWADVTGGHVPSLKHSYYNLDTRDLMQRQRVIYRLSYLAKNAGKKGTKGIRYFGSSQHKPSSLSSWNPSKNVPSECVSKNEPISGEQTDALGSLTASKANTTLRLVRSFTPNEGDPQKLPSESIVRSSEAARPP